MNINKLVPRLTISAKLAVAFVLIAAAPLAVVAGLATAGAVRELRQRARATLEFDLELAALGVTRSLRETEQHLTFLVDAFGRDLLMGDATGEALVSANGIAQTFLRSDSSAVLRARLLDARGSALLDVGPLAPRDPGATPPSSVELYLMAADEMGAEDGNRFMPVELLDPARADEHSLVLLPAVAVLQAIRRPDGSLAGVALVEASAAALFDGLEVGSPGLEGVTGLVDQDGFVLYHSRWKRDWSSLLGQQEGSTLEAEFGSSVAAGMRSGQQGTVPGPGHTLVSHRSIDLGPATPRLTLYRVVPLGAIDALAWGFLRLTTFLGFGVSALVLLASFVAARQLTKPIYRLQRASQKLAAGEHPKPVRIETNDELEDLARDFSKMAGTLHAQRNQLEALIEDRTRDLTATRAHLSEVVANATDAIIGLDNDGCVTLWNDGAAGLFGYAEEEALGSDVDQLIGCTGPEFAPEHDFIQAALRDNGGVSGLRTHRRTSSGEVLPVSLTQSRIVQDKKELAGSSLIIRDYRVQARLDEQMRRSERLAAVSIMAAGLAHEINNPLAILGNRIELMQRDVAGQQGIDRFQKDLEVLGQHVERIRGLTSDLLSFAREDTDEKAPVVLTDVVGRVVRLLDKTFRTKGVTLTFAAHPGVPEIHGDEKAMETVFVNLLLNAGQATPPGGEVTVSVVPGEKTGTVRGEVRDTGPGVPLELRSRVFEPFFTTKGDQGGTGLGLVVCRTIVERHAGTIALTTAVGGGCRFVIDLPTNTQTQ